MGRVTLALALATLAAATLHADTVTLVNGDKLTGQIRELSAGKLGVETSYGALSIPWDQVQTVSSADTFVVEFVSGQSARGTISTPQPGLVQVGAEPAVPAAEVVSIRREVPEPGVLGNWHGSADFGYALSRGNTEIDSLAFSVKPELKRDKDRTRIRTQSLYSVQDGTTTSNMHMGDAQYDRFLSARTFLFLLGKAETDEKELLDLRTSEGGGLGYRFQPDPQTAWSLFGGLSFLQEKFERLDRKLSAEGIAGVEFETSRWAPFVFATRGLLLPLLTDGRYRVEWNAGLRVPLLGRLSLGVQLFDNFDSDPPRAEIEKNDFGVISTVGFSF